MKRWPVKPLGELISIEKGKKAPMVFAAPANTSLRYLQIEDLRPDASIKYCEPFNCPRATESDVIIAWDGANAGTVSCNLDGFIGSTLAILRPVAASALSAPFLSRFLEGNFSYLQQTSTGATIPHISKSALMALPIPAPPLAEQERIVKLLDDADELRKLRVQADRRSADLVPALFHEMFGDPTPNPMGWPVKSLPEVAFFQEGPGVRKWQFRSSGIKLINVGNIVQGQLDLSNTDRYLDEDEVAKTYAHFLIDVGDLVMATSGATWGKVAFVEPQHLPICLNTSVVRFRPLTETTCTSVFLRAFFETKDFRRQIEQLITGSAQPNFGPSHLKLVRLPIPPLPLQREFAHRVTEIRELEASQAASRVHLEHLFQSMLHRAFNQAL